MIYTVANMCYNGSVFILKNSLKISYWSIATIYFHYYPLLTDTQKLELEMKNLKEELQKIKI
jgi:hypothetical protein